MDADEDEVGGVETASPPPIMEVMVALCEEPWVETTEGSAGAAVVLAMSVLDAVSEPIIDELGALLTGVETSLASSSVDEDMRDAVSLLEAESVTEELIVTFSSSEVGDTA